MQAYLLKKHLVVALIIFTLICCTNKEEVAKISYIKVLTEGSADSVTLYNKGLGLDNFLYYEPQKDSAVLRLFDESEPFKYKTYIGKFNNKKYLDSLLALINFLRLHGSGYITPDSLPKNSTYCGASYFVVYKDEKGVHGNGFLLDRDLLYQFDNFFHRLPSLPWKRKIIDHEVVDGDYEIVNAVKQAGVYDSIETPYIPVHCQNGIDVSKIVGTWRTMGDLQGNNQTNYSKVTNLKSGKYFVEKN